MPIAFLYTSESRKYTFEKTKKRLKQQQKYEGTREKSCKMSKLFRKTF